jgi:acyl carrier protein
MTASNIREDLNVIFRKVFGDDDIALRDEMTAADVDGWDSMMTINLMIAIEKHFKIKFAAAELANIKADGQNIGTLIALIGKKRGAGA